MPILSVIFWIISGYISGSLVWGYWIGRYIYGVDLRTKGSGNIGATNVFRVLGPVPGIFTFILDVLKGALPVMILKYITAKNVNLLLLLAVGIASIIGSRFSIFLKGSGGKAVNCSFGVILALIPQEAFLSLVIWVAVFLGTGYVSMASISAAIGLPLLLLLFKKDIVILIAGILICILIVLAHKENIKRLFLRKENRFKIWKR